MGTLRERLWAAVRAGDAEQVLELLAEGADSDMLDADGLPLLCTAVAGYASEVAQHLVQDGADPDRRLSDGTTPLLRAVEGGSPVVVEAVLGRDPLLRLPEAERERLLAAARRWYEAGAEAELRQLTGAEGPARRVWVEDDWYGRVEEVTLGGRTVRAGHGGILTSLEAAFKILTPVEELVARAVRHGDDQHVDWWASLHSMAGAKAEVWSAVVDFHRHPEPLYRAFVAELLTVHAREAVWAQRVRWYDRQRIELLAAWVEREDDGSVLARVLESLSEDEYPGVEAVGLRHAGHPDPRVRRSVFATFDRPLTPETVRVVRAFGRDPDGGVRATAAETLGSEVRDEEDRGLLCSLLRDGDPEVRRRAAHATAMGPDRSPEVTEVLVELLDADEQDVRLSAAYGLSEREDPETPEAYARVGPLGPEYEHDVRADGLWRWRVRNGPTG